MDDKTVLDTAFDTLADLIAQQREEGVHVDTLIGGIAYIVNTANGAGRPVMSVGTMVMDFGFWGMDQLRDPIVMAMQLDGKCYAYSVSHLRIHKVSDKQRDTWSIRAIGLGAYIKHEIDLKSLRNAV